MAWRALQRLGDWSFSIYMVHVPLVYLFYMYNVRLHPKMLSPAAMAAQAAAPHNYAAGGLLCIILLVVTIIIAALTYRFVEVRSRNGLNKLSYSKRTKVSAAALEV